MPPLVAFLFFVGWTPFVFAMGMRRGRRLTEQDLATRPIPVTVHDEQTWLYADRREVSLSQ